MEAVMTIAGCDPSGGAGIAADIKTFSALNVHPTCVATNITAQNEDKFFSSVPVDAKMVTAQIKAILDFHTIKAVKIGMIYTKENLKAISKSLTKHQLKNVVLDPIMLSSTGEKFTEYTEAMFKKELLPHVSVITPNVQEAEKLTGKTIMRTVDMQEMALELASFGCENVVITGFDDGKHYVDMFYDGENFRDFKMKKLKMPDLHGTGCTFSSAVAAFLALGRNLNMAVREAKEFTFNAIKHAHKLNDDKLVLNHFFLSGK